MYRVDLLRRIPLDSIQAKGYGFLEEVLALILRADGRVVETPIVYTERRQGKSKLSIREAFSTLFALLRIGKIYRGKRT
jgi:dolichol-phosphate mannosyltransferase